jgi:hypothetical protein
VRVRDVVAADGIHRPCAGPPWRHCHPVKLSRCDWLGELNKGAHDPICVLRPLSRSQPARVPKPCTSTTRHLVELKALRAQLEGLRLGRGHPLPRAAAPWARAVSRGARRYGGGRGSQPRRWCWLLAAAVAGWRDSQHAGRRKIPLSAAPTVKFPELQFLLLWSGPDLVSITVNLCYNCTVPRSMQRQDASAVTARAVVAALNPRIDRDKKRLC